MPVGDTHMAIIDKKLIDQYKTLHSESSYGSTSYKLLPHILPLIYELKPKSILDYGCGQSNLIQKLDINGDTRLYRYDPSINEISDPPDQKMDLIINTDVLEHIPENDINDILEHIRDLSENVFFSISTVPAAQILPSGENAHCTVYPKEWWENRIREYFPYIETVFSNRKRYLCKTWSSKKSMFFSKKIIFLNQKIKYKFNKIFSK